MKENLKFLYLAGACVISGALISFFISGRTGFVGDALLTGIFLGAILFITLALIHILILNKLTLFTGLQALLYQSFLYITALTFSLLASFVFYTVMKTKTAEVEDFIYKGILNGFLYLVTLPFSDAQVTNIISPQMRGILFTISMMIFLIGVISIISSFIEIRWREVKQKQLITDAELKALQAQIEPHFLFNSLNTIVSIVQKDPAKAEELLIKLSDLLHYLFSITNKIKFSLKDELIFTKNYLSLMQARFTNKLQVDWDENIVNNDCTVPALIFQPIIENAIRHGWQDKSIQFKMQVKVESNHHSISIIIKDSGVGMSWDKLKKLPVKGHALDNLTERLFLEYQEKNLLTIKSQPGQGTSIEIKIPVKK